MSTALQGLWLTERERVASSDEKSELRSSPRRSARGPVDSKVGTGHACVTKILTFFGVTSNASDTSRVHS